MIKEIDMHGPPNAGKARVLQKGHNGVIIGMFGSGLRGSVSLARSVGGFHTDAATFSAPSDAGLAGLRNPFFKEVLPCATAVSNP